MTDLVDRAYSRVGRIARWETSSSPERHSALEHEALEAAADLSDCMAEIKRLRLELGKAQSALHAFRNADAEDWNRLDGFLGFSGHGRFWRDVFKEFRHAIGGTSLTGDLREPTSTLESAQDKS